jgi:WS/DGAT/MGAT family acyltransferase
MRKLSVLDLAFFLTENSDSPKHVAGLMLCKKPDGARSDFARKLIAELKTFDQPTEPFDLVISFIGLQGPHWSRCTDFNIDEHVFYHKPKRSISWLEVQDFVARLHEPLMDRSRPLWEYHLIDGIEGGRFAIYTKVHHAYADGVTMARWVSNSLSESPDDMELRPAWCQPRKKTAKKTAKPVSITGAIRGLTSQTWSQVLAAGGLAKMATQQYLEGLGITHGAVTLPFSAADDTPLTGSASPGRNIATTWVSMEDIKQLGKQTRSTLNHVALSCIDGALHRYLAEQGVPIDHPITVLMPVNLRSTNHDKAGNQVGAVLVEMAEPTDDPYERLHEVGFNLRNLKQQIEGIPGDSIERYSILMAMTGELIEKLRLSDRLPTHGHTLVSNLPGPREELYLKGAKIEQMYPISILLPGLHMNVTLFSCGGILNFGIVSTRDLPELNLLAEYISEEFEALQQAVFQP